MCLPGQGLWVEPSGQHALWGGLITSIEQQIWGVSASREVKRPISHSRQQRAVPDLPGCGPHKH